MKPLETTYRKYGYEFKLLDRTEDVAIFEQYSEGKVIGYEVFEVQKQEAVEVFGKAFEAKELPPSTEQWGVKAFTCGTIERAKMRQKELLEISRLRKEGKIAIPAVT